MKTIYQDVLLVPASIKYANAMVESINAIKSQQKYVLI